ncbi:CoA transferase [Desulfosporosinus nitroreducens]|uniref:CoA transferase n=1 Tax=Desulfosporosinus nitroreducens TaxID=2018668 RepID=UPI00207C3723|nr:CoA transferase [Desulfosporosinus nitroreducens]MCO1602237.1 CoA transferase [Desulfosporosinus nitroreducens]
MSLGALEPKFWQAFCRAVGRDDLADKQFAHDQNVFNEIEKIFKTKTQVEWTELFKDQDVCCEPILELSEARKHPQVRARHLFTSLRHPDGKVVEVVGNPLKFSEAEELPNGIPPGLGEQTREVLQEAGFADEEIKVYEQAGPGE